MLEKGGGASSTPILKLIDSIYSISDHQSHLSREEHSHGHMKPPLSHIVHPGEITNSRICCICTASISDPSLYQNQLSNALSEIHC